MEQFKKITICGMTILPLIFVSALIVIATILDIMPASIIGAMAICMTFGLLFGAAFMVKGQILSEKAVGAINDFIGSWDFLTLFIAVLVAGSIMTIDRKLLLRAISGYIPAILCGVVGAMIFGVAAGLLVGVEPGQTLSMYVLPVMGGGTGGGALPMSDMFSATTGQDKTQFLSFAMPILAIGNIFAILFGAILNKVGEKFPFATGNGELVKSKKNHDDTSEKTAEKEEAVMEAPTMEEVGISFMVVFGLYAASLLFRK